MGHCEVMKQINTLTFEELLALKAKVDAAVTERIDEERARLTASLERLNAVTAGDSHGVASQPRRLPIKYRNPDNPAETWAGRGLRPRWLVAAMKGGKKKLSDFAV